MIYSQPLVLKFVSVATGAAEGIFTGLGSTWSIDRTQEKIAAGSFRKTLAAIAAGAQRMPVLLEHDPMKVIGAITSAEETDEGLLVTGKLILGEPIADRAYKMLAAKAVGLSVGFLPRHGGVEVTKGIKTYTDVDWLELSVTSLPANAQAVVHQTRSLAAVSRAEFKTALLEGAALPPMPRRMVEKMARLAFGELLDTDEPKSKDLQRLAALKAAAAATLSKLR